MVQTIAATTTLVATPVARSSQKRSGNEAAVVAFLQLLLAVAFAALLVALAPFLGITVKSVPTVGADVFPLYSLSAAWQDFRSLLSFALGALICCLLSGGLDSFGLESGCSERAEHDEDAGVQELYDSDDVHDTKAQLCAYTL